MATGTWGGNTDPRVFRVNIAWKRALQNCMTGFHIRDVGLNTLSPQDVTDAVTPWANTQFIKALNQTDDLISVDSVNLVTKEGFAHNFNGVHGASGGDRGPSFLTVPISLKGGIRRRYGNGRMLWPVSTMANVVSDQLGAAAVAVYNDMITDLMSRFVDGGALFATMRLVHLHPALAAKGTRPAVPASWYDVTSIRLNSSLSSLRRRKVGVGS